MKILAFLIVQRIKMINFWFKIYILKNGSLALDVCGASCQRKLDSLGLDTR
jgi:hypothetical protein